MRRQKSTLLAGALSLAWFFGAGADLATAQVPAAQSAGEPTVELGAKRVLRLFPAGDLYPQYKADLHRPGFGLVRLHVASVGIAESGSSRFDLRLGGRFGLLRLGPRQHPERGWQLSIIAGLDAQFDPDNDYDNVGWDGNYGLALTTARGRGLAFKVAVFHTSSHVGDEYAERIGRRRLGYTREELTVGLSWAIDARWRAYAEAGWGYELRNDELQEPGRAQIGLEHAAAESLWRGRLGWFAALDVSATEERDWRLDTSVQAGLLVLSDSRQWRAGLGYYDGRPPLGEFFQDDESYFTLGLWLDI